MIGVIFLINFIKSHSRNIIVAFLTFVIFASTISVWVFASSSSSELNRQLDKNLLDSVGLYGFDEIIDYESSLYYDLAESLLGADRASLYIQYFDSYYQCISLNAWNAVSTQYGSDGNFTDDYLAEYQNMFYMKNYVPPFQFEDFIPYARARKAAELSSSSFSSDVFLQDDIKDITVSSKGLKNIIDYWSDYYKPKDNIDQFTYSYQDAANKQGKGNYYRFSPYAPVYIDTAGTSSGWGSHAWTGGAYYLPFLSDDDKGDYYSEKYYHIYSTRDDGTLKICIDTYLLKDNSLAQSNSYAWDTSRMNVGLAFFNNAYYLQFYKSYFDYKSNTNSYSNIYFSSALSTGLVTSGVSITPQYFLQNLAGYTTFTPDTDTVDDYGFIISSSPFELWANQTGLDVSKIPDDYKVTISGDNFYDYSITNSSGDTTTINNYITNNYNVPSDGKDDSGSGGTSGNVTVGGNIDVSGKVDINVNVTGGSNTNISSPSPDDVEDIEDGQQGINDLIDYYQGSANEIGSLFAAFLAVVPAPIRNMVPLAVGVIVFLGLVKALH